MQGVNKDDFIMTGVNNRRVLNLLLPVLAVIGILLSIELTVIYINANFVAGAAPSFCSVNDVINCDDVARTKYSVLWGLPLSVYGLGFYAAILLLGISQFIKMPILKEFKSPKSIILVLSSISIITSIILATISIGDIHKVCTLCFTTYILNIMLFLVSKPGKSFKKHFQNAADDINETLSEPTYKLAVTLSTIIIMFGLFYLNDSKVLIPKNTPEMNPQAYSQFTNKNVGNLLGSSNPKLIIQEYTDYECPFCALSNFMMHRLASEVPGIMIVHNNFPIGAECNKKMGNPAHKQSCLAARYSIAARKQGQMWAMNDLLFDNQSSLSEKKILELAKTINLDTQKLQKDAHDPDTKKELYDSINRGIELGIDGTPTFFIGMKKYVGIMPYPELKSIVLENMK